MDQNLPVRNPESEPLPEFTPEPFVDPRPVLAPDPIDEPRAVLAPERVVVSSAAPAYDPIVESKPVLATETEKSFTSGIISLVLGLITWVFALFSGLLDISFLFAGVIAFLSAVLAIFFGAKAKKENPASKAGKAGRFLGWLYIIALLAIVIGLILGVSAIVSMF